MNILKYITLGSFILCISTVGLFSSCNSNENSSSQIEAKKKRFNDGVRLQSMLRKGKLDESLRFIDTLHHSYPRDPQFYFAKGWIYYMKDDSCKSVCSYKKAIELYDSLIVQNDDFGDKINRAFIFQFIYGKEKFLEEMDAIVPKDNDEKIAIDSSYKRMIFTEKQLRKLFKD